MDLDSGMPGGHSQGDSSHIEHFTTESEMLAGPGTCMKSAVREGLAKPLKANQVMGRLCAKKEQFFFERLVSRREIVAFRRPLARRSAHCGSWR